MRRAFKPYLRHPLSKRPAIGVSPPTENSFEVTVIPQWDTVLRYDGSPLMVPEKITDPNEQLAVRGDDVSYKDTDETGTPIDWIAIGLATENQPIDEFRSPKEHPDADDGDSSNDGIVYTNIGPTRSVLSFDLRDAVPEGAVITKATLELVPLTDKHDDDVWNEFGGVINENIWPSAGVQCEIHNLVEAVDETCTWNARRKAVGPAIDGFEYPVPSDRWHRQEGQVLPNPIGAGRNTRRWDLIEGQQPFDETVYNGTGLEGIVGDDGNEIYGHVGYGSMGGGSVTNVPENVIDLDGFEIKKEFHTEQHNADSVIDQAAIQEFQDINVTRAVKFAHENQNGECNLLLRAKHWVETDFTTDQTDIPETFQPPDLELTSIVLLDTDGDDQEIELDHEASVRFNPETFDIDGDENTPERETWLEKAAREGWNVTYDWQVKYPDISINTFSVRQNGQEILNQDVGEGSEFEGVQINEGDVFTVVDLTSDGGFNNRNDFEFYTIGEDDPNDGDEDAKGLNTAFTASSDIIPDGSTSVELRLRVGARAQGANLTNDGGFDPSGAFPSTTQEYHIGTITEPPVDVPDPEFSFEFNPVITDQDDFGSPINLVATQVAEVTVNVINTRPEFDWNDGAGIFFNNEGTATINKEGDNSLVRNLSVTEVEAIVDSDAKTASYKWKVEFTGQDILNELTNAQAGDRIRLTLGHNFLDVEGVQDGFTDTASVSESHTFQVGQVDTSNDFDITEPARRRGVFEVFGIHNLVDQGDTSNDPNGTRVNDPDSPVKAPVRQVELAPSQLKCNSTETFNTVLMPIEEVSRFADDPDRPFEGGIRGTKNKFAVIAGGLRIGANSLSLVDDSDIRATDGSTPTVSGSVEAKINLVTSGGVGEFVERKRLVNGELTDIFVPSDLAVYYFNRNGEPGDICNTTRCQNLDNTGQDCSYSSTAIPGEDFTGCPTQQDVGWVYYRALSRIGETRANGRFGVTSTDYSQDDFDSDFNEDDGLEYVLWEKLSGDPDGQLDVAGGFDGTDPNIGAFVFLLDDRYDNVDTPTVADWPVPLSTAFRLTENTTNPSTSDDVRNNPTLLTQFVDAGVETHIIDRIDYKIKSLDNGDGSADCVFATIDANGNELTAPDDDGSSSENEFGKYHLQGTKIFNGLPTRDSDGKIIPLTTAHSLFLGATEIQSNTTLFDICEITPVVSPTSPAADDALAQPPMGIGMDDFGQGSYCNYKSHFWNGKGVDNDWDFSTSGLNDPFGGDDDDKPTAGFIPLIWRRRDTPYFVHYVNNGFNTTTPLPHPLTSQISDDSPLAYHGINILYGNLHDRLRKIKANVQQELGIEIVSTVQYVVEVIRGGSVYHRDMYRLSNAQSTDPNVPADADFDFRHCESVTDPDPCQDALSYSTQNNYPRDLADTLYQFGLDGEAWRDDTQADTSWYAPSDWRAGDTIRVYAISAHADGDEVIDPTTGDVISAVPTPDIQRIKKYCPVGGSWNATVSRPPCCSTPVTNCNDGNGRVMTSPTCCDETVCVIKCVLPPGNDWGFGLGSSGTGTGTGLA